MLPHQPLNPSLTWGHFYQQRLTLIPTWIINHIHCEIWDQNIHPFPKDNSAAGGVWERINNFMPHFTVYVITCPWWDHSYLMTVKGAAPLVVSNENIWISNTIWLKLVPYGPIDNKTTSFQIMALQRVGDRSSSEAYNACIKTLRAPYRGRQDS